MKEFLTGSKRHTTKTKRRGGRSAFVNPSWRATKERHTSKRIYPPRLVVRGGTMKAEVA